MPDETYTVLVEINANVKKMVNALNSTRDITGKTASKFSALAETGRVAAGVLLRDVVRGAMNAFNEIATLGGRVETLKKSFAALVRESGSTTLSMETLRNATRNTVSDVDLLTSANQALLLGLPTEGLEELFGAAINLGHAMGIDAGFAVDSLTKGIGRQSKMILDNLGVVFDASEAYEWYAKQLGITSNELTDTQKKLGWQEFAISQVIGKAEELGDVTSEAQLTQERFGAAIDNLKISFGKLLTPLVGVMPVLQGMMPLMSAIAVQVIPKLIASKLALIAVETGYTGVTLAAATATNVLSASIKILLGPIGWILAAIALLAAAWQNNWFGIRDVVMDAVGKIMEKLEWLSEVLKSVFGVIRGAIEWVGEAWNALTGKTKEAMDKQVGVVREGTSQQLQALDEWLDAEGEIIAEAKNEQLKIAEDTNKLLLEERAKFWMSQLNQTVEGFEAVFQEYTKHYDDLIAEVQSGEDQKIQEIDRSHREEERLLIEAHSNQINEVNAFYDELLNVTSEKLKGIRDARSDDLDDLELNYLLQKQATENAFSSGEIDAETFEKAITELTKKYRETRGDINDSFRIKELQAEKEHDTNLEETEEGRIEALQKLNEEHNTKMEGMIENFNQNQLKLKNEANVEIAKLEREKADKIEEIKIDEQKIIEEHEVEIKRIEGDAALKRLEAKEKWKSDRKTIIGDAMEEEKRILNDGMRQIKQAEDSWLGQIKRGFSDAWKSITSGFNSLWSDVIEGAKGLWQRLTGGSIWPDMMKEMVQQTESGLNDVTSMFERSMPDIALNVSKVAPSGPSTVSQPILINNYIYTGPISGDADITELANKISDKNVETLDQYRLSGAS